jgi:arylsulfatase A-like enzyme
MKDYLRCVAAVDDNVGRVLDYLDETGLADNTVVVYSSDQGFYLGEHGWFDKRWMYEESLRTPLMVRWPGVSNRERTNDDIVSNLDFAETFLDSAAWTVPERHAGRSSRPHSQREDTRPTGASTSTSTTTSSLEPTAFDVTTA